MKLDAGQDGANQLCLVRQYVDKGSDAEKERGGGGEEGKEGVSLD